MAHEKDLQTIHEEEKDIVIAAQPVARIQTPAAVSTPASLSPVGHVPEIRYLTEQEEARERLKASVDRLTEQASLQVKMQTEPLKLLGGASAVGAVLGLVLGSQLRRSKKVYVDAHSPVKHQKAFIKAQQKQSKNDVGGALVATLGTLAVKLLTDKVVAPRLEEVASNLLDKAGQPKSALSKATPGTDRAPATTRPASAGGAGSSLTPAANASATSSGLNPVHPGVVAIPESQVEAKAQGTPIDAAHKANPNAH